jgi:diacylglycerol kinase family enzyme
VVEPAGLAESLRLGALARRGRLLEHPAVTYTTGEAATIRSRNAAGLPVEVDGTPIPTPISSASLSVVPEALVAAYPAEGT